MVSNSSIPQNPSAQNPSQPTTPKSTSSNMSSNPLNSQNPDPESPKNQNPEISNQTINPDETGQISNEEREKVEQEEVEEEGECGFCLFMKGGGCKDSFIAWENCVEEAEKNKEDIVEKCFEVTSNLKKCMEAHSDYYEPILRAEKAAEEEVNQEIEREAELKKAEHDSGSKAVEMTVEIEVKKED